MATKPPMQKYLLAVSVATLASAALGCESAPRAREPVSDPVILTSLRDSCNAGEVAACERACDSRDLYACNEAGHIYELGVGVPRDGVGAAAFYRKACDGGDMGGCFNAAYVLENGIAGRRDVHCALALYDYACNGGYLRSCLVAGYMLKNGIDVERDDARAAHEFKKACDGGNVSGCNQLKTLGVEAP